MEQQKNLNKSQSFIIQGSCPARIQERIERRQNKSMCFGAHRLNSISMRRNMPNISPQKNFLTSNHSLPLHSLLCQTQMNTANTSLPYHFFIFSPPCTWHQDTVPSTELKQNEPWPDTMGCCCCLVQEVQSWEEWKTEWERCLDEVGMRARFWVEEEEKIKISQVEVMSWLAIEWYSRQTAHACNGEVIKWWV